MTVVCTWAFAASSASAAVAPFEGKEADSVESVSVSLDSAKDTEFLLFFTGEDCELTGLFCISGDFGGDGELENSVVIRLGSRLSRSNKLYDALFKLPAAVLLPILILLRAMLVRLLMGMVVNAEAIKRNIKKRKEEQLSHTSAIKPK